MPSARRTGRGLLARVVARVLIAALVFGLLPVPAQASLPAPSRAAAARFDPPAELPLRDQTSPAVVVFVSEDEQLCAVLVVVADPNYPSKYHRARWLDPGAGRLVSTDPHPPVPESSQSLNRFLYVVNRPVDLTDPSGLWPTRIHNQILEEAFKTKLNQFDIRELQHISAVQDHLSNQSPSNAYQHAMRSEKQRVEEAQTLYDNFLAENLSLSRVLLGNPHYAPNRWLYLGKSLHAISDNISPAHSGFQVWNLSDPVGIAAHKAREWEILPTEMRAAVREVQREYEKHLGASMRFEKMLTMSGVGLQGFGSFASTIIGFAGFVGF